MPAFVPHVSYLQSFDGKSVLVTDDSPYGAANSDGVTLNNVLLRSLVINDGNGNLLQSIVFSTGSTTFPFNITQDYALYSILTWTLADHTQRTNQVNFLLENNYYQGLIANTKGRGCCKDGLCADSAKAMMADAAANFYFIYAQSANAEEAIGAAGILINS